MIWRVSKIKDLITSRNYIRILAKLGGCLGRKHDGEPGYIYISHGFNKIATMLIYKKA